VPVREDVLRRLFEHGRGTREAGAQSVGHLPQLAHRGRRDRVARRWCGPSPRSPLGPQTTRDLVEGSGLVFEDRGEHDLKGIDSPRRLFAARRSACRPRTVAPDECHRYGVEVAGTIDIAGFSYDGLVTAPLAPAYIVQMSLNAR
jgi:hypothetical protein